MLTAKFWVEIFVNSFFSICRFWIFVFHLFVSLLLCLIFWSHLISCRGPIFFKYHFGLRLNFWLNQNPFLVITTEFENMLNVAELDPKLIFIHRFPCASWFPQLYRVGRSITFELDLAINLISFTQPVVSIVLHKIKQFSLLYQIWVNLILPLSLIRSIVLILFFLITLIWLLILIV